MYRHSSRSAAFTLMELLVAVAVVAIMVALVFPGVSAALESSRSTKCISNLRSLSQAALLFSNDNDGYLPPAMWANSTNSSSVLDPYLKDASSRLLCPAAPAIVRRAYGINLVLEWCLPIPAGGDIWGEGNSATTFHIHSAYRNFQLNKPAGIILFADTLPSTSAVGVAGYYGAMPRVPGIGVPQATVDSRHSGGARFNASFVDGHAESLTMEGVMSAGYWTNGLPNPFPYPIFP